MSIQLRLCPICDSEVTGHHNKKYCCTECSLKAANAKRRIKKLPQRNCGHCDILYPPPRGDSVYCSDVCYIEGSAVKRKDARQEVNDPQMRRLFHHYQNRPSLQINNRPDGNRVFAMSDTQLPFIDEPLWQATLNFVDDYKPHDIFLDGDILDCYEISQFDKRPDRKFTLDTEFEMGTELVLDLRARAAPGANVWWIDGNHEERIMRVLWKLAQGFSTMVRDISEQMHLDDIVAGYVPYGKHIEYLGFVLTHGGHMKGLYSEFSGMTARKHLDRYRSSGANGHTHRLGSYSMTDMHNRSHTWYELGCLCGKDLEYVKGHPNWQHGFMIGTVHNNALHPQLVHVVEQDEGRSFFANGQRYVI